MLYSTLKSCLFKLRPEDAHDLTLRMASLSPALGKLMGTERNSRLEIKVGNVTWASPVGLAAGLDKNAEALAFFDQQGFGAIECGTITLKPQEGNPKPRMFRYPEELSLRNSMGFPNKGLLNILPRIKAYEGKAPIGANIGKNKDTTPEESIDELSVLLSTLDGYVDYFVINVSSPNTPGLRALQEKGYLSELFAELNRARQNSQTDLYLKIAPDLESEKIIELVKLATDYKLTGLIATNTTIMPERGMGGISGALLNQKAKAVRSLILKQEAPLELIGVGGISETKDLLDFWKEGGKAVQIYTSYIYEGPGILKKFQNDLLSLLDQQKLHSLEDFMKLSRTERMMRLKDL